VGNGGGAGVRGHRSELGILDLRARPLQEARAVAMGHRKRTFTSSKNDSLAVTVAIKGLLRGLVRVSTSSIKITFKAVDWSRSKEASPLTI